MAVMELMPQERRKIYEEEKVRIEARRSIYGKRWLFGIATFIALGIAIAVVIAIQRQARDAATAQLVAAQSEELQKLRLEEDAYEHAQMALLRDNPRLSPDKLGKFTPALVKTSGDFFVVNVVYEGWDIHGNPVGKSAQCGLRFSSGVWIAISVPKTPEYGR